MAAVAAWLAYFLVPSQGGLIDGLPAGPLEAAGISLVLWIAAHRVRLAAPALVFAVTVLAAAASIAVPGEPGLQARQFANATASGGYERGTEHPRATFTRIDSEIDFRAGRREFPLAFFNDNSRFNFYRGGQPLRHRLEFSITWTGWWHSAASPRVYLHSPGASAQMFINGTLALETSPQQDLVVRTVDVTGGWQRIHIIFLSPYSAPRVFSAGVADGDQLLPFSKNTIRTQQLSASEYTASQLIGVVKTIADVMVFGWLVSVAGLLVIRRLGEVWQERWRADRAAVALMIAAGAIEAMRYALPWTRQLLLLAGGDDPMTYEGYARDIQLNGILMNGGRPLGEGEPFYYQALYPYFLAAAHFVFGEDMFGVLLLQRFLVVLTAVAIVRIAIRFAGRSAWPAAMLIGGLFAWWKFAPIAADLLNESLYVPLLMAWTAILIHTCASPSARRAALTGVSGALAAMARSTSMLSWPFVWAMCAWQWRRQGWLRLAVTMAGCSLAVFSLIAVRNWIVAHQFAATSTELGITLLGGNEPPPEIALDMTRHAALYERLALNPNTARVVEFAMTAPGTFAMGIARKAAFALGFYEAYAPGWGYSPVYMAVWIGAIGGYVVALRKRLVPPVAASLPLVIALTQYVALVIVYPKGERLILPIHTLLAPYAAVAAHALVTRIVRPPVDRP